MKHDWATVEVKIAVERVICAICGRAEPRRITEANDPRAAGWFGEVPEGCSLIARGTTTPEGWQSVFLAGEHLDACAECAGRLQFTVREAIAKLGREPRR